MERFNIVHGDTTTAGGTAIGTQDFTINMGKRLVMVGDNVICPKCKTTGYVVPDGIRRTCTFMGREVALNNDICMCACEHKPRLIHSMTNLSQVFTSEEVIAYEFGARVDYRRNIVNQIPESNIGKRIQFFNSETNEFLANRKYIAVIDGHKQQGITDENGYANIDSQPESDIQVHLIFEAPTGTLNASWV